MVMGHRLQPVPGQVAVQRPPLQMAVQVPVTPAVGQEQPIQVRSLQPSSQVFPMQGKAFQDLELSTSSQATVSKIPVESERTESLCSTVTVPGVLQRQSEEMDFMIQERLAEVRAEMESLQANNIEAIRKELADVKSAACAEMRAAEQLMRKESAAQELRSQALETRCDELQNLNASLKEALERGLGKEAEARALAEKSLREQMAQQSEKANAELMTEMRERMDGQKVMRDDVGRLVSCLDEVRIEVREKLSGISSACHSRMESVERSLTEETYARSDALSQCSDALSQLGAELRKTQQGLHADCLTELGAAEKRLEVALAQLTADLADVRASICDVREENEESVLGLKDNLRSIEQDLSEKHSLQHSDLEKLGSKFSLLRDGIATELPQQVLELQRKLTDTGKELRTVVESKASETEVGLRRWVDTTVTPRLNSLEETVRPKVVRAAAAAPVQVSHHSAHCPVPPTVYSPVIAAPHAQRVMRPA
eukprot:TRINITY_DN111118_c0_g1_i1.p1 TRINITY_DN111118_c0_g1~~TRINITY_DN111118_c0_g1_i1.p1  ORF type:complete len:517 (+),score=120.75 TRINITY_DN111118_c0_g1_i1:99-1553(+)